MSAALGVGFKLDEQNVYVPYVESVQSSSKYTKCQKMGRRNSKGIFKQYKKKYRNARMNSPNKTPIFTQANQSPPPEDK
jgi:hypothetical protein